ncbi:MAG TPA: hypothetical protein VF587_20585 [Solirubrobacteraceae bacterium]|jgi:hypothetical protein
MNRMTDKTVPKLAGFACLLALVSGGAALAGGAVDPDRGTDPPSHGKDEQMTPNGSHGETEQHPVRGLAVAEDELRVVVDDPELRRGATERLSFRIVDTRGETVEDFELAHEKRMHLILARRDLTGFQHLHPSQAPDGTWTTDVRIEDAGSYRMFADFTRAGEPHTLGADLRVDGPADLRPLPAPADSAKSDGGYDVRLERDGEMLRFAISRDGQPVETEPYLGAGGHLVVLREGDMAFLHVHPEEDGVSFMTELPSPGRYRMFLQFKHEGRVQTVAFTEDAR